MEGNRLSFRSLPIRFALAAVLAVVAVTVGFRLSDTSSRNDFTQDYVAARAWRDGRRPYAATDVLVRRYLGPRADFYDNAAGQRDPHPPGLIVLLSPLSFLPYAAAWTIWKVLIVLGFAGSIAMLCATFGFAKRDALLVGVCALILPSAQSELLYGGTTVVVLVLLVVAWRSLERGADTAAGIATGAAAALKLFPALLLVWFLRQRRTRVLASMVICAGLIALASFLAFGTSGMRAFAASSHDDFTRFKDAPINMSLPSMVFRVLDGTPAVALAIVIAVAGLLIAIRSEGSLAGRYWSAVPWMILLSPVAWYAALMIPVVVVATINLARARSLRAWHLVLFAAACSGTFASIGSGSGTTAQTLLDLIPTAAVTIFALVDAMPARHLAPAGV